MRVKDIQFKNAEHVIEEIKSMNVKGGSPLAELLHGHSVWPVSRSNFRIRGSYRNAWSTSHSRCWT